MTRNPSGGQQEIARGKRQPGSDAPDRKRRPSARDRAEGLIACEAVTSYKVGRKAKSLLWLHHIGYYSFA